MEESTHALKTTLGGVATDSYDFMNATLLNPSVIIILIVVAIIYIFMFMSLGESNLVPSSDIIANSGSNSITIILISFFILLIFINGFQYFFGMDIVAKLKNLFTNNPQVDILLDTSSNDLLNDSNAVPQILMRKQVFNIPENDFVYSDAKALCKAHGARLATYGEVESAYRDGGEWCNYGWSDGQMALFPTQQKTFDKLRSIEGHENDCGRPGVNGGHIANPAIKFGVNCYGYKPRMTKQEEELMATRPIYPKTLKDIAMENRVNYWKDKLTEISVSPFNHNTWSRL